MTFIDNFSNLNMGNFMSGWNNWFTPTFSCNFMPSFFDLNIFSSGFNNWSFPSFNSFSMPSLFDFGQTFNFNNIFSNNIWDNTNWNNTIFSAPTFGSKTSNIGDSFSFTNKNKAKFSMKEYNAQAGEKLVNIALNYRCFKIDPYSKKVTSLKKIPDKFIGNCARYVKVAIRDAGLGTYQSGDGYQMSEVLRRNSHFKEVATNSVDVHNLPAGCVIVFNRGSQGYDSQYGHVEITTGDGRGVSDGITNNLRKPDAIFVPV